MKVEEEDSGSQTLCSKLYYSEANIIINAHSMADKRLTDKILCRGKQACNSGLKKRPV